MKDSGVASPKFLGEAKIWEGKMFDFRRETVFYLRHRFSKHKMTGYAINLGWAMAHWAPGYAYDERSWQSSSQPTPFITLEKCWKTTDGNQMSIVRKNKQAHIEQVEVNLQMKRACLCTCTSIKAGLTLRLETAAKSRDSVTEQWTRKKPNKVGSVCRYCTQGRP